MKELNLKVSGMSCQGCENRIKNTISNIENIKNVIASHEKCQVKITFTKEADENVKQVIIDKIKNMGFEVEE